MANSVGGRTKRDFSLARLGPGVVLSILVLQALVLLILIGGWVGHWAWLRDSFPGGLFAGSFPIIVTWAGAAGGIANAVHGLTSHWPRYVDPLTSRDERRARNAWSVTQGPLGAVYGSAAVLLLALVLGVVGAGAAGTLDLSPTGRVTLTAIAFIVGYHQQVFHDLVKRTVEAIFAPRSRPPEANRAGSVSDASQQSLQQDGYADMPVVGAGERWLEDAPSGSATDAWPAEAPASRGTDGWPEDAPAAWSREWDAAAYVRDALDQPSALPYDDDRRSDLAAVAGAPVVAEPPRLDHQTLLGERVEPAHSVVPDGRPPAEAPPRDAVEPVPSMTDDTQAAVEPVPSVADDAQAAAEPTQSTNDDDAAVPAKEGAGRGAAIDARAKTEATRRGMHEDAREVDGAGFPLAEGEHVRIDASQPESIDSDATTTGQPESIDSDATTTSQPESIDSDATAGQPEPIPNGASGSQPAPAIARRTRTGTTRRTSTRRQGR